MRSPVYGPATFTLPCYSNCLIIGATSSGKTTLCMDIILNRNKIYDKRVDKVIYLYQNYQSIFDKVKDENVIFVSTIEEFEQELENSAKADHRLCFFDDFVTNAVTKYSAYILEIFIRRSHHERLSVFFNTQLLYPSPKFRSVTLNSHFYIFFRNHHEAQLHFFMRSVNPNQWRSLVQVYLHCINEKKFGYLFMSNHPQTQSLSRLRSSIIPATGTSVFHIK